MSSCIRRPVFLLQQFSKVWKNYFLSTSLKFKKQLHEILEGQPNDSETKKKVYVAGIKWGTRKYMVMERIYKTKIKQL